MAWQRDADVRGEAAPPNCIQAEYVDTFSHSNMMYITLEYDPDLFISMAWHQFASIVSKHNFICFHGCDKVLLFINTETLHKH